jgi:Sulfotransferase domain
MPNATSNAKVFGIGLSKTGTSSLAEALNLLGIPTVHFPCDQKTQSELATGDGHLSILDRYDGVTDITIAPFYPQLDCVYPGSKFILTVRDADSWLASVASHWDFMSEWCERDRGFQAFTEFIVLRVYGSLEFDPERFATAYQRHNRAVRDYFRGRDEDLLVLNICAGEGWEKLCEFLGRSTPDIVFPKANRKQDREEAWIWVRDIDETAADVEKLVPPCQTMILVDDCQFSGSRIGRGRIVWPFTEREGTYWGPPADDAAALEELARLRASGAKYLAIGWPSFWWLDHYREFGAALFRDFACLLKNDRLIVFDLGEH